jgi:hypothetical protein
MGLGGAERATPPAPGSTPRRFKDLLGGTVEGLQLAVAHGRKCDPLDRVSEKRYSLPDDVRRAFA